MILRLGFNPQLKENYIRVLSKRVLHFRTIILVAIGKVN